MDNYTLLNELQSVLNQVEELQRLVLSLMEEIEGAELDSSFDDYDRELDMLG
jgi:hypothetical protein